MIVAKNLYSKLLDDFICNTVASCRSQTYIWCALSRYGRINTKTAVSVADPDLFTEFFLDLPGGPDPFSDFFGLIPEFGGDTQPESPSLTVPEHHHPITHQPTSGKIFVEGIRLGNMQS